MTLGVRLGDYRGWEASQALAELRRRGYRTGPLARREVDYPREGVVVAQTPAPGIVAFRSTVNLTMAVAPPKIPVINLIGDPVRLAMQKAVQSQVRLIFDPPRSARIAGARIRSQKPEAGGVYGVKLFSLAAVVDRSITVQVEYPLANVVDMPLRKAQEILVAQMLKPFMERDLPLPVEQIFVRASRPRAGTQVRPGQAVGLAPGVRLDAYRGVQASQAIADLRRLQFKLAPVERHRTPSIAEGLVIAQKPAPGIVAFGTIVTLRVAVAPLRVIDLIGDSLPAAREKVARARMNLSIDPPASASIAGARVWFQVPGAGGIRTSDSITVQVEYPLQDLASRRLVEAREILAAQLLNPVLGQQLPLPAEQIFVRASQPAAKAWVRPGQKIPLELGVFLDKYLDVNADDAVADLRRQGFRPKLAQRQTEERREGQVLAQDPPSGIVPYGASVQLTVAVAPPRVIDLIGDAVSLALRKAEQDSVELVFNPRRSERIEGARIWFQDPGAGAVRTSDSITVQVEYPLPDVTSMRLDAGREILAAQMLKPFVERDLPLPAAQILVRASKPPAGTPVRPGQEVRLDPGVRLAAYRGVQESEALADLRQLQFKIAPVERRQSPNRAEGEVVDQDPRPGIVAFGTIVILTVAEPSFDQQGLPLTNS